jgi:hypothetical protein
MVSWVSWCNEYTMFVNTFNMQRLNLMLYINGSGNDFMENLYDHGILFWYCRNQGTNEYILIFQPHMLVWLSLVVQSSVEPKLKLMCS